MTVEGLNSDLYFADNPIYITFNGIASNTNYIEYFPVGFSVNGHNIKPIRLYVKGRTKIEVNISELVKLMFQEIPHNTDYTTLTPFAVANNWVKVNLLIKEVSYQGLSEPSFTFTKTFVDGGNRTYEKNQNTAVNRPLTPNQFVGFSNAFSEKIPQWGGYPIDYYYFNSNKELTKSNVIPNELREYRNIKGCDPMYFKFKNSKGGYSYWLFENSESYVKNRSLGIVERVNNFLDLGNDVEAGLEVTGKIPKRYVSYMSDLINSKEIFIYLGNSKWEKVTSDNNEVKHNPFNTNEKIKLKFKKHHRYNPTLIW